MTNPEKLELEFYKNGSAQDVLKRFVFNEKEEKLVRDAIRTAHLANPRMKLIRGADALLREVARTREVIVPVEKTKVSAEVMANFELMKINSSRKREEQEVTENQPKFFGFKSKYGIAMVVVISFGLMAAQYFQSKHMREQTQMHENLINGIAK